MRGEGRITRPLGQRSFAHPTGLCANPRRVIETAARYGLVLIAREDIAAAREFAASKLGPALAREDIFKLIQSITGAAVFAAPTAEGGIAGVFAGFPLTREGADLCAQGRFDALDIAPQLVCPPGQRPHAWYGWGFVAVTKFAAWAVVMTAGAIQSELFWAVPAYARAVTPQGAKATQRLGYRPFSAADPTCVWIPARGAPSPQVTS